MRRIIMTDWLINNWEYALVGFYALEKIIKLSPTKADDMVFDMFLKPLFNRFTGKR